MSISIDEKPIYAGSETTVPAFFTTYILDAGRQGKLFDLETYRLDNLNYWTMNFFGGIARGIDVPSRFDPIFIEKKFIEKMTRIIKETDLAKMFESVDADDIESIKEFIEENRERERKSLQKLETFFRRSDFPSPLWMEYSRFNRILSETSAFIEERIEAWAKYKPTRKSQIRERNKRAKLMAHIYGELNRVFLDTIKAFLRFLIFMEVWSCEKETDLFEEKRIWSFKKMKSESFEAMLLYFHNSTSLLRQAFFRVKPQQVQISFAKPTEWAFKQLILMA